MSTSDHATARLLERRQSPFQQIEILEHPRYGRQLVIDDDLQISESDSAYNVAMVAPLMTLERCERVVVLGGGDGGVLHELVERFDQAGRPLKQATLVDIDADVLQLSKTHLPRLCGDVFEREDAEVLVDDAFAYIEQQQDLDGVIYDLTMDPVREDQPRPEFIHSIVDQVHASLRPGGMMTMQCCGAGTFNAQDAADRRVLLGEIREACAERFDELWEQNVFIPSYEDLWTFMAARKTA